jgi:hypothetical protein
MQIVHKYRIPALLCALAVLLCELIAHPFANTGVCDDGPYILMAQTLAATGHVVYNGWAAPMLTWQLYLAAALIKLFGFSFFTVRFSSILVGATMAFALQRTLVRASINERNATIGTLAFVLSPLYLMLSATFMTDIHGLFALVLCLYGCLRALHARTSRTTIAWLCIAIATNALCGTSRQNAWLGILIVVPSTLWLLRAQRSVVLAGIVANLSGILFIVACMQWLKHQPYSIPEHVLITTLPLAKTFWQFILFFLEFPFLLLPLAVLFLPKIRHSRARVAAICGIVIVGYFFLAFFPSHLRGDFPLEPTLGNWVSVQGGYEAVPNGDPADYLSTIIRVLLTILSLGGLLGLIASLLRPSNVSRPASPFAVSWKQLAILLGPFSLIYILLLLPRAATTGIFDRYFPTLVAVAMLCLVRCYQDQIQPRFPSASILLVAIMAIYGVATTHNMFALERARVALAAELRANGVPETSVDNGWEYNLDTELQHADHINFPTIVVPSNAYVPVPSPPSAPCPMFWYDYFPHIHPLYGVSFDPNACDGPAPFAPVHYSRWPYRTPGTLYVVRYTSPAKP